MKLEGLKNKDYFALVLADLLENGHEVVSEFQITVRAWEMFPEIFGLRDYENDYPNHKSVCNIYMSGKTDPNAPVVLGWMEKVKPNYYRLKQPVVDKANNLRGTTERRENTNKRVMILQQETQEMIWRATKSNLYRFYIERGGISNSYSASLSFLNLQDIDDRFIGEKKANEIRKTNSGKIVHFSSVLKDCLNNKEAQRFRKGVNNEKQQVTRKQIIQLTELYNLIVERWNYLLQDILAQKLQLIETSEVV